jgi:DNA repair exonuclease SbcCD ATPase subunit
LWRAEAAEEARHFVARYRGELPPRETQFLDAVLALHTRAARVRRWIIGGTIGLLVAIVAAGSVALVSIRRAKVDAVGQAGRAQREAERAQREATHAREAEQRIKDQLAVIEDEQHAKERARAEVVQGKEQLKQVNGELEKALERAQAESGRARDETANAQKLADSLQHANTQLGKLLAAERARAERLEQERKKISTQLR